MNAPVHYPPVETHLIDSKHVRQTFKVQVMRPACRRGETTRFPVVYATDGNRIFDLFKGISWLIQSHGQEGLRFILVGIGYPGDCPEAGGLLRRRDFTFPGYPALSEVPPPVEGVQLPEPGSKDFGGAEDFQQFLGQELFPLIDARYQTIAGYRTYFGHSAGGGFGLFTLFTRTELFRNYIISSPGLTYHGESPGGVRYDEYDFMLRRAREFIAARKSLDGVKLYLSAGSQEEFEPGLTEWRLTSSVYRLVRLLTREPIAGFEVISEVSSQETHLSIWPLAFMHGVQAVLMRDASEVVVVLETSVGNIEIAVDVVKAPLSASAFLQFVHDGCFTSHGAFYRTVRSDENDHGQPTIDVIQGGWPQPPASLPGVEHESTRQTGLRHKNGTVSLARGALGTATGAAFFICIGDQPALDADGGRRADGEGFAAFGQVIRGMDAVLAIHRSPTGPRSTEAYMQGQMLESPIRILRASRIAAPRQAQ